MKPEGWTQDQRRRRAPASIGARGGVGDAEHQALPRRLLHAASRADDHAKADIYYVQPGHYLCLGDNSAQSSDSRKWGAGPGAADARQGGVRVLPASAGVGFIK